MSDNKNEIIDNTAQDNLDENLTGGPANDNLAENGNLNENMTDENNQDQFQKELAEWKDKYVRLAAEFDNFKKRSFKEKMDVIQTAGKDVMISLLDVIDDTERAEKQLETASDVQALKEGMQLVFNKLKNTLQQKGLKAFDSIGEVFDVEKHEAITEIPAPDKNMEGKVIDEVQKGYVLNDKLIRHAKVVIGKASE